jgi:hypothetical protein
VIVVRLAEFWEYKKKSAHQLLRTVAAEVVWDRRASAGRERQILRERTATAGKLEDARELGLRGLLVHH